eukprot:scaffold95416_cov18-Tisochrysis_lutea.AAC.2
MPPLLPWCRPGSRALHLEGLAYRGGAASPSFQEALFLWHMHRSQVAWHAPTSFQVASREPLFNQMIINRYNPGDGIRPHVDLMRFEDGIAVISLGDSAVMQFSQPEQNPGHTVQVGIIKVAQRLA